MIDIHSHLLPALDDGAKAMDESLLMVDQYLKAGFKGVIATPHYDQSRYMVSASQLKKSLLDLKEELYKRSIELELYPGSEIQISSQTLNQIKSGQVSRLADTRYVLLELPFFTKALYAKNLIYSLQLEGYVPVLAHCERYAYIQEDLTYLYDFIKTGCLIQVNFHSIGGSPKSPAKKTLIELLQRGMVDFIATDAHSPTSRNPDIRKEKADLLNIIAEDYFKKLTETNPAKLIQNDYISPNYKHENNTRSKELRERGLLARILKRKNK